ncbi:MAG TPA: hypothetical protein DIW32_06575 [Eubacterium sp.]|jgi:hypothetical protein|nr:hypothetical protein [Eubacterium sp.]
MRRHNKRGYFSPTTIMALLLAVLALGLPFIMNGPVNDEDILTPLPTPESTVTTITEDTKIAAVPTQKPVAVTTKKRTDVSPKPSVTSSGTAPSAVVSSETVKSVQDKAVNLEKVALGLYRDNGDNLTADALREKAGVPDDEHFIVTISKKNGNVSKVSYFTKDYSVAFSNGKFSALANIAGDDFEDAVLFL